MKPFCEHVQGTRNSVCNRMDTPMTSDPNEVGCLDCLYIRYELGDKMRKWPIGSCRWTRDEWTYQNSLPQRPTRWLQAMDSWSPNWNVCLVQVTLHTLLDGKTWRVSVWGADDDGCNKDFPTEEVARRCFERLPPLVDHQTFIDLGFEW
ncbi:hypothetical protein [Myxococcus phage Mx1]|nr:hypothetical protein [Myxococcus phage Mx1]